MILGAFCKRHHTFTLQMRSSVSVVYHFLESCQEFNITQLFPFPPWPRVVIITQATRSDSIIGLQCHTARFVALLSTVPHPMVGTTSARASCAKPHPPLAPSQPSRKLPVTSCDSSCLWHTVFAGYWKRIRDGIAFEQIVIALAFRRPSSTYNHRLSQR